MTDKLREAAQQFLVAWDTGNGYAITDRLAALRSALAEEPETCSLCHLPESDAETRAKEYAASHEVKPLRCEEKFGAAIHPRLGLGQPICQLPKGHAGEHNASTPATDEEKLCR